MSSKRKKIISIMGSPHLNSNLNFSIDKIIEGTKKSNFDCVKYNLSELNIKNCIGCRKCIENGGNCILKDDMIKIFDDIKSSDILIIGSPIYICQVNGYTKTFLDRLYPLTDEKHKPRFGKRGLIMVYTYGAPIPLIFNKYIKYTGKSLKAMGLIIKKNIVIHGCTTINKVRNDKIILEKLFKIGQNM